MCVGCHPKEIERHEKIEKEALKAKQSAVELKKIFVLYDLPKGGIGYMEAEAARSAGIKPIKYITRHRRLHDVPLPGVLM